MARDDSRSVAPRGELQPDRPSHVVLRTAQLARMRDWYLNVLNAEVTYEGAMVCFMTYDHEPQRFGIVQIPAAARADGSGAGLEHIAFTCATLGELLASYRRLKSSGIEPYWPVNYGSTVSMYYRDPDGNCVELEYDVFAVADPAKKFTAERYAENSPDIIFDPEDMIRRYETGATLEGLMEHSAAPAGTTARWRRVV
jgi:catechol 2,3-dioxygenase-like lactoylglutathione lyase family enzyme